MSNLWRNERDRDISKKNRRGGAVWLYKTWVMSFLIRTSRLSATSPLRQGLVPPASDRSPGPLQNFVYRPWKRNPTLVSDMANVRTITFMNLPSADSSRMLNFARLLDLFCLAFFELSAPIAESPFSSSSDRSIPHAKCSLIPIDSSLPAAIILSFLW